MRKERIISILILAVAVILSGGANAIAKPIEIEQYFPVGAAKPESGWRIKYEILERGNGYGHSAVWHIYKVQFMRGYKQNGEPDWINVLNNLALAEMYVPYNDGKYVLDVYGHASSGLRIPSFWAFNFVKASQDYLPKVGAIAAQIQNDGYVASEVMDDGVRFMDNNSHDKIRRGQVLSLWASLSAANYRYVLKYGFTDDGTISIRVGGTAENLHDDEQTPTNKPRHVHMAAWRMEFDLGAPEKNMIQIAERHSATDSSKATSEIRPFNNGHEGGETWNPEFFTSLKVMNTTSINHHNPPRNIGYKLVPYRSGSLRTVHPYTKYDFWVTRTRPENPERNVPELTFIDVPENIKSPESITDKSVAIWYTSAVNHMPRTEDFGVNGYKTKEGVALAMWTGFDLVPHDLWHKTPLLDR